MSALRALVLVGVLGCSHSARTPEHVTPPAAIPAIETTPVQSLRPAQPTRVDQARMNLNTAYANLLDASVGFAPARPSYAMALAPTCRTSADCGGGALSCRAREDGVRVCMGAGSPGDACWFDTDCVSGSCTLSGEQRTCH